MTFNIRHDHFGLSIAAVSVAIILVAGVIAPVMTQAYALKTFSGRATVVSINSPSGASTLMDTGPLSGSEIDATPIPIQTPVATADGLLSVTMGSSVQAESQAALGELVLLPGDLNQITAYFAMASSRATCKSVSGFSDFTSLTMGGKEIQVTGQPNQVVSAPGLTLTINEQIISGNSITVNALHLRTALGTDVIIASASSSASCPNTISTLSIGFIQTAFGWGVTSQPGCIDFTTGGGWVKPPPNKGTFGFVAGYKNGGTNPRGNLEYHDHTYDMNVHSEDVSYYNCGNYDNTRVFGGSALVNHESGYCYQVFVQDNGEPGKNTDYFAMWIWTSTPSGCPSDGSIPTGTPIYGVGNYLGGGNIQIHTK